MNRRAFIAAVAGAGLASRLPWHVRRGIDPFEVESAVVTEMVRLEDVLKKHYAEDYAPLIYRDSPFLRLLERRA